MTKALNRLRRTMKRFDDIFSQKVRDAFDNYNADHLADEGWKSFVKKHRRKSLFPVFIPLWAKAASVILLVSAGSVTVYKTFYHKTGTEAVAVYTETSTSPEPPSAVEQFTEERMVVAAAGPVPAEREVITRPADITKEQGTLAESMDHVSPGIPDGLTIREPAEIQAVIAEVIEEKPDLRDLPVMAESEPDLAEHADVAKTSGKTSVMAGLSGIMASVEDKLANAPGISVGFYLEHRLTKMIAIRPGLALARHNYGMTENFPGTVFYKAASDQSSFTGEVDSYENHMEMLTMEVPVNLVFTLLTRDKKSLFVSAGTSTVFYLNQQFSGTYRQAFTREYLDLASGETSYETNYSTVNVESEHKAFSRADYFGLTNLSAGYSFPFGKSSNMLVEPYVQLPVSDLTSLNLRIRYGGLSVKVQFGQ